MFHSTSKDNDYDYKKKQENLNVNKNRITAYDHILPDNNPAQRLVAEEEEEQRQKEAAQLKESRKLSGEEAQLKPIQRFAEEEETQLKTAQFQEDEELQMKESDEEIQSKPVQAKGGGNGLPDDLKAGVESMSGIDMSEVRVHKNSAEPTKVGAHAYTQGSDIHVAPGQDKHIPHEAWHVVQQHEGRVKPTTNVNGMAVNDNAGLEKEADDMGAKASQFKAEPNQFPEKMKQEGTTAQMQADTQQTFTVPEGWTLSKIAQHLGVSIEELKKQNAGKLKNWNGVIGFNAGEVIDVPTTSNANTEQENAVTTVDSSELNGELENAANSNDPLRSVLKALLAFPMYTFLDDTAGSKINAKFGLEIPTPAAGVKVTLGGGFEQERKATGKTLATHKLESELGIKIDFKGIDGEGKLFNFFEITAENLDDAVSLIYYGIYKLGRSMGDTANDWPVISLTSGASLPSSAAIYYGLNFLYGSGEDYLDRLTNSESAEENVAAIEADIFDKVNNSNKPFDESNQNEVAYGGGLEFSASAGINDNAKVGAKGILKNSISSKTLNATGVYGAQDAGYWDDYQLGSLLQSQLEIAGGFSVNDNSLEGKHVFNWGQVVAEKTIIEGDERETIKEKVWKFTGYDYELTGKFANLAKMDNTAGKEMFTKIIQKTVAEYSNYKSRANDNDPNARLPEISIAEVLTNTASEIGMAGAYDIMKSGLNSDVVPVKDQITVGIKLSVVPDKPNTKTKMVLTIGNEKTIEVNVEVAKLSFIDFDVLGQFTIFDK